MMKKDFKYIVLSVLALCIGLKAYCNVNILESDSIINEYIPSDSVFAQYLHSRNIPIYNNNEIKLLPCGKVKFEKLFDAIRKARHHIHLEYFNFRNDSIGREIFTLLAEKAKEGVKVRAMFDDFGNFSNNRPLRKEHLKMLNDRGVEIIRFDPLKFPYVNHIFGRDHQKIVVIDGEKGFTGGMNIADYYIKGLEKVGAWRDMHMCIEGPAVTGLQKAFLDTWNKETKQDVGGDVYFPYGEDSVYSPNQLGKQIAIVQRVPHKTPDAIRRAYVEAIDAAERHIRIVTPYFTPTRSLRKAIYRALKRGVRVEIMISEKSDIPISPDGGFYFANRFRKAGAHVYIYKGGFHHTKVMTIDDRFCTVGSANLNSRSMRADYEINAFIMDLQVTYELDEIYKDDKKHSERMTKEYYKHRGAWRNFVGFIARLLTPVI